MAPSLESLEAKMDTLLRKFEEFSALQDKVIKLESTVVKMETCIVDLSTTVASLNKEVLQLKEKDNNRDQLSRSNAVRLFGLSVSEEEDGSGDSARSLTKRIYDTIVKPVLVAAKANKQLESVPSLANTITEAYRVKSGASASAKTPIAGQPPPPPPPPPPIIIKFSSPTVRMAFLRNKRASLPIPPAQESTASGIKWYTVVEDLTAITYKKMREMADCSDVEKVWSIDGKLRYTIPGDKTVRKVKSVFHSLADIIKSG